ncbi:hypothetical protein ACP70R_001118 [Stipagrostis hirtigluma subsp. patula]
MDAARTSSWRSCWTCTSRRPTSRRRLRLVWRHWREVIDERALERRSQLLALAFVVHNDAASPYIVDDLPEGRRREVWTDRTSLGAPRTQKIGTRNGLLHLYADGAITLANPATGKTCWPSPRGRALVHAEGGVVARRLGPRRRELPPRRRPRQRRRRDVLGHQEQREARVV